MWRMKNLPCFLCTDESGWDSFQGQTHVSTLTQQIQTLSCGRLTSCPHLGLISVVLWISACSTDRMKKMRRYLIFHGGRVVLGPPLYFILSIFPSLSLFLPPSHTKREWYEKTSNRNFDWFWRWKLGLLTWVFDFLFGFVTPSKLSL